MSMKQLLLSVLRVGSVSLVLMSTAIVGQQDDAQRKFDNPPNTQVISIPMTPPQAALEMIDLSDGFKAMANDGNQDIASRRQAIVDLFGYLTL